MKLYMLETKLKHIITFYESYTYLITKILIEEETALLKGKLQIHRDNWSFLNNYFI